MGGGWGGRGRGDRFLRGPGCGCGIDAGTSAWSCRARFCSGCRGRGCTSLPCFIPLVTSLRSAGKFLISLGQLLDGKGLCLLGVLRRCLRGCKGWEGKRPSEHTSMSCPLQIRLYFRVYLGNTPGGDRKHPVLAFHTLGDMAQSPHVSVRLRHSLCVVLVFWLPVLRL